MHVQFQEPCKIAGATLNTRHLFLPIKFKDYVLQTTKCACACMCVCVCVCVCVCTDHFLGVNKKKHTCSTVPKKQPPAALLINCGFVRVSLRELHYNSTANTFDVLHGRFGEEYGIQAALFAKRGHNKSIMEYAIPIILKAFTKKWHPTKAKQEYLDHFSQAIWSNLSLGDKRLHTLSDCKQCMEKSYFLQCTFPLKPTLSPPDPETQPLPSREDEASTTRTVLDQLNSSYCSKYGHTFLTSAIQYSRDEPIVRKKTKYENKKAKRAILRECRDSMNKQLSDQVALVTLAEDESLGKYQRKRLSCSFTKPSQPKRPKVHASKTTTFDENAVLEDLNNLHPAKKINWSEIARKHGVCQSNGGQIIKEFAVRRGVNVLALEHREREAQPRLRSMKRKLPGMMYSMCTHCDAYCN